MYGQTWRKYNIDGAETKHAGINNATLMYVYWSPGINISMIRKARYNADVMEKRNCDIL